MIEAIKLYKSFGPIRAVNGVSFKVEKGDILGFLGPNGAGKSTTMKMITGFLLPDQGTAKVGGHDIIEDPLQAKRLFGYLPENSPLYNEMTVQEFLTFIAAMRGFTSNNDKIRKLDRAVEICHLDEVRHQTIETLSKGYHQRVGMAQAVLHDPPCLIMDEPTDGLDPNQKQGVRRLIASMAEEKAIVLSTHILEEVESMCNRVIIIAHGRMLVDESPEALRRRHPRYNATSIKVEGDSETRNSLRSDLEKLKQVDHVELEDERLIVIPRKGSMIERDIIESAQKNNWPLSSMEKASVKLDEVFWQITHNK